MNCLAVIGAGFGDEGKGLVTSYLCSQSQAPLVVRFSGGQQAGHQVMVSEEKGHIFSNFGSGTLQGVPSYWSRYCTVDPIGLLNELDVLLEKGAAPQLTVDARCPVTTPFDVRHNHRVEKKYRHGTCGVGVGATFEREENRYSLCVEDLFNPTLLEIKLDLIRQYYHDNCALDHFLSCCNQVVNARHIKVSDGPPERGYDTLIFEGSQGLLLDQRIGFFPHVTRSNTGSRNILEMGYAPHVYLVTRAYQVRHGNGPMTNERYPHNIPPNPYEDKDEVGFQGRFRRTLLDVDLLRYALAKDPYLRTTRERTLVITCLDLMQNEYRFTVNKQLVYCGDELEFVDKIADCLNIDRVLLARSPFSRAVAPHSH